MLRKITAVIALLLALTFIFCACGCGETPPPENDDLNNDTDVSDNTSDTTDDKVDDKTDDASDSVTDDKTDDAEDTPADAPADDPEDDVEQIVAPEKYPKDREVKNILMLGNSHCYYYVEELCGIAAAGGYDINLANLYYSGCSLGQHVQYYTNGTSAYEFYLTTKNGRQSITNIKTFQHALGYAKASLGDNWDVISLQHSMHEIMGNSLIATTYSSKNNARKLYDVIRASCPEATLVWHEQWAYDVGFDDGNPTMAVPSVEVQLAHYEKVEAIAHAIAENEDICIVPSGDAWQIARENALVGQNLCQRENGSDRYHDGTVGGGQYLNACVWYEVLFGKSCIGNTWRPDYELSEEKIAILQEAAHKAVAAIYGEDYAK